MTPPSRTSRIVARAEAPWGIGALAFAEALFLPVPIEAALAPLMIANPQRRWRLALWALIGSVLGILALYLIGLALMGSVGDRVVAMNGWQDEYAALRARFEADGPLTVAVVALTPIPFTLAALAAGAARMNVLVFLFVAGAVRGARYAGLALLVGLFGERVRAWYERASRNPKVRTASALVAILAAAGLAAWWFLPSA